MVGWMLTACYVCDLFQAPSPLYQSFNLFLRQKWITEYGTYSTTRRWITLNPLQCSYSSSSSSSDMMWSLLLQLTTTTITRCRLTGTSTHRWRPYHNWRSSSLWPVSTTVQYMYLTIPYTVRTVRQINKRKGNQHNYSRYIKNLEVEEKDIINHHN